MKKFFIYLVIFGFCTGLSAQVNIGWVANTAGVSIAIDNYNNVYTVNYDYNPAGDITLVKRNSAGQFQWQAFFDQTNTTLWEKATWVATDNSGNIVVTGTLMSGYSNPVVAASIVMKFNSAGTLLWRQVFENSFDGSQTKKCLIDEQNNIYILGTGMNGSSGLNLKVKKLSPDGAPLWTYFNAIGSPVNFKFTPDNGILVIGRGLTGSINGYAKLDRNGNPIWSLGGVNSTTVGDAAGDAFGNTYIVNLEYIFNPTKSIVKKINSSGSEIWSAEYIVAAQRLEVGSDNMPVIAGYPSTGSFGSSFVKFSTSGGLVWANMDADSSFTLLSHAQMKMDNMNNIYLAASTMTQMAVCKVNSNGTSGWTVTTPGGYSYALEVGNDYSVYLVGGNTAETTVRLLQTVTSVSGTNNSSPDRYWLGDNYPNPFNPSTKIMYSIPDNSFVKLTVHDALGKEVETIVNESKPAGNHTVEFNASKFSSGVYFYKIQAGDFSKVKKMILVK
jgi:hypothetical protein